MPAIQTTDLWVQDVRHFEEGWDISTLEMWYEALPPFIIMAGCITITGYGLKIIDKLFLEGKVSTHSR